MSEIQKNESTIFSENTKIAKVKARKKSSPLPFIILGAVVILLIVSLVLVIVLTREPKEPDPPKFDVWEGEDVFGNAAHLAYPLVDENSVTEIEIFQDGQSYKFIKSWDENLGKYDWRIDGMTEIDLNATTFEMLRMWLCTATTKTPIRNATQKQLSDYGVDKQSQNGYTLKYSENGVDKSYTVRIGNKVASKDNVYYAYIEGRNHVYKLSASIIEYTTDKNKLSYLSPVINTFFSGETNAMLGIDKFDVYVTDGNDTTLKSVVSIQVNERDEAAVEFKAVYGFDDLGRQRTTIASTSYAIEVFSTLYMAFSGEEVVAFKPSDKELKSFGLASEDEKYYINVEFANDASFASPAYAKKDPGIYVSLEKDGCYYVLSEYYGERVIVKVPSDKLSFLGTDTFKLFKWTDTTSVKTSFFETITETETAPGLSKMILKTGKNEEIFDLVFDPETEILTVTAEKSGLVFADVKDETGSFNINKFRNLYVYLLYFPFINSFNSMSDEETSEYIKEENLVYSITAYRNDDTVVRYKYYATSASLAIESVETGKLDGEGVIWDTPSYGNIVSREDLRRVINAIDKLLAGEELLPDEDILA